MSIIRELSGVSGSDGQDREEWVEVGLVTYKDETTFTEKDSKEFGEPNVAFFVKVILTRLARSIQSRPKRPKKAAKRKDATCHTRGSHH
jgi:hypothetical protein